MPPDLIGQAAKTILWYPTIIVKCNCKPTGVTLVVITGFGNMSICGHCMKGFRVMGLQEVKPGIFQPLVEIVLPTEDTIQ